MKPKRRPTDDFLAALDATVVVATEFIAASRDMIAKGIETDG